MNKLYELQKREKKLYKLNKKKLLGGSRPLALQSSDIREERLRKEKYSEDKRKYDKETIKRRILNAQSEYELQQKTVNEQHADTGVVQSRPTIYNAQTLQAFIKYLSLFEPGLVDMIKSVHDQLPDRSTATLGAFRKKLEKYEPGLVDIIKSYITNYEVSAEYRDIMRDPIKKQLYKIRPIPIGETIVSICTPIIQEFLYEMIPSFDGNIYNNTIPYEELVQSSSTFAVACYYMQNYAVDFTFLTPGSYAEYYASSRGGIWITTRDEEFIRKYGPGPYNGQYYDAITLASILDILVERDRAMESGREKYERKESARRTRQMQEAQRADRIERQRELRGLTPSVQALRPFFDDRTLSRGTSRGRVDFIPDEQYDY